MPHATTSQLIQRALQAHTLIPGFNIPYLPIIKPVVQALKDCNSFGLVSVAELEWAKFESKSLEAVRDEYNKFKLPRHTRLHLDHIPVINEDNLPVDYAEIIGRALGAGYESVMVDGPRLPFEENVA
ncbi:MAG: class II fructose-bisphosphate aldolase, partial [Deltaproteobacteria bacterium]|nr:class II fructose-bisphosphate aldolase [Deltaproteobacteria bacterium]